MKPTALRYGLYASLFELVFFLVVWVFIRITNANFDIQEVVGYLGILVCLSFVFFGIRYYRDHVNGGDISFLQALKLGLMIMLVPAICFGLTDTLYVVLFDPHFYEKYSAHMIDELRKSVPAAQFPARLKAMKAEMEMYRSPVVNFVVMFLTVAAMGIIVSLVSALILQRRLVKTAVA
jgi:Protein of unknown function (DUF4199)